MLNRFRRARRIVSLGALLIGMAAFAATASEVGRSAGQTVAVPVYSHVFFGDRGATFNLATTLSIRNIDPQQSLAVNSADYYDSGGRLVRKHLAAPVVLKPLASTEVFISESDTSGGFGASFLVRWSADTAIVPPVIECLMIGARSGQGISFVSHGRVVQEAPVRPLKPKPPGEGN